MLAEAVTRIAQGRGWDRAAARAEAETRRETVFIFDFDSSNDSTAIWRATVPLAELSPYLPVTCRYSFDVNKTKLTGAIVGAVVGGGIASLLLLPLFYQSVWYIALIAGFMFGPGPGALAGWFIAPRYGPKPIWMVRRVWEAIEGAEPADGYCNAPVDGWRRRLIPLPHSYLEERTPLATQDMANFEKPAESMARLGFQGPDGGEGFYYPVVHRGTTLYEMLQQRVAKRRMSKVKMSGWQKVQIGSTVGLALGAILLLIFLMLITTEDRPPEEGAQWHKTTMITRI